MASVGTPPEVKERAKSFLIEKIRINDNDAAGGRYTNFTKNVGLLEKLHHLNPVTYAQLIRLANDIQVKGPLYKYFQGTFNLPDAYSAVIAQNVIQAALILKNTCKSGSMKFDLNPKPYLATAQVQAVSVDCEAPK